MVDDKILIDEVSGWLRIYKDGTVDRTWCGPPEVKFLTESVSASDEFVDGVATQDVVIDSCSGLGVRVYIPELKHTDSDKFPILLHFHGGGFCVSQADWYMYHQFYTRLVVSARVICISVRMRLAPEHRLPAALEDAYNTLRWLRDLAKQSTHFDNAYDSSESTESVESAEETKLHHSTSSWLVSHTDYGRIFLIGDSSGGNIAHMVASRAGDDDLSPIRLAGGILIHPGFVREKRSYSELELRSDSAMLTLEMIDKFLSYSLPHGCNKDHPFTCPMSESAPPISELILPPLMVAVAENDLIRDTELEYFQKLVEAGKNAELVMSPGMGHTFHLNRIAIQCDPNTARETENLILKISDFIRRH